MTAENTTISLYGYSNNPVYDKLIDKLGYLAGLWRRHKTTEIADQYQTVLRTLILLGYDDELPVDVELPEELMPVEYISLFTD
ncbi:MAG: hypothetical protein AAFN11_08395 [Chloroflexota bacterium]